MYAKNNRSGLVIIAVLWMAVLLMVVIAIVGRSSRLDAKICLARADELRCKWATRAGVDTATAVLNADLKASDCLNDLWSDNDEDFNDVELEGCFFDVLVVDEASKLNINTATKKQLLALTDMTEEIADAILDWRDRNDQARRGGVEGGYYENLRYGYKIRNGRFRTIRELLLVKGVTEQLLYGEDTNFNGQLDYNENDGDQSPPADNADEKLDKGWIAYLTCYSVDKNRDAAGRKRININKAGEKELRKFLDIKKSYAKWIVENRKKGYRSIADLINNKSPKHPKKGSKKDSDKAEALDLETFSRIADRITVTNRKRLHGKVNINTAPKVVLSALLGGDETADKLAEEIIYYRKGLTEGTQSIAELLKVESMKVKTFKKIANYITTRSDTYMIRCFATAQRNNSRLATEAVVDRSKKPYRILYWYQGAK